MAPHTKENNARHRRQYDKCRIPRHITVDSDKNNGKSNDGRCRAAQYFLHKSRKETALFSYTCADDADEYHTQRSKSGEVGHRLGPDHPEPVNSQ